jgi:hypothetical protein
MYEDAGNADAAGIGGSGCRSFWSIRLFHSRCISKLTFSRVEDFESSG